MKRKREDKEDKEVEGEEKEKKKKKKKRPTLVGNCRSKGLNLIHPDVPSRFPFAVFVQSSVGEVTNVSDHRERVKGVFWVYEKVDKRER